MKEKHLLENQNPQVYVVVGVTFIEYKNSAEIYSADVYGVYTSIDKAKKKIDSFFEPAHLKKYHLKEINENYPNYKFFQINNKIYQRVAYSSIDVYTYAILERGLNEK